MDDVTKRTARCFISVFPDMKPEDLPQASQDSVASWDSVAQVTLLSAISEEFGVDFEIEEFEQLHSYPSIMGSLENKLAHS